MLELVHVFALLGIAFAFGRRIETGRESLGAGLVLPIGYVIRRAFP